MRNSNEPELEPAIRKEVERQLRVISRGAVDLLPADEFRARLTDALIENRPLRVKQGFDPTSPDIHLGHTVGIRKLRQFQKLGHTIVLIIGDYTALVGDPSGQSATRPQLSYDKIMANAETYQQQFFRILDREKTEVRFNGEWFRKMEFKDILHLTAQFTVARILERDDFSQRLQAGVPISVHELLYPLMQAYDSVAIRADIELGATEQKFNLLAGRVIQQAYGQPPQCILTMPILVGTDGVKKMSKSLGNYVGITDPPNEIFGRIMSIPDELIYPYFELATDVSDKRLEEIKQTLDDSSVNPMLLKKELAETLVDMYHPKGSGAEARREFERVFSKKQLPDDIPVANGAQLREWDLDPENVFLVKLMTAAGLSRSNSEARKLITGGAVTLDSVKVTDPDFEFPLQAEQVLKVGKRRFLKLRP